MASGPGMDSEVVDREAQTTCGATWIYHSFQKRTTRERSIKGPGSGAERVHGIAGYDQEERSRGEGGAVATGTRSWSELISGNAEHPAGPAQKDQLRSPRLHRCG